MFFVINKLKKLTIYKKKHFWSSRTTFQNRNCSRPIECSRGGEKCLKYNNNKNVGGGCLNLKGKILRSFTKEIGNRWLWLFPALPLIYLSCFSNMDAVCRGVWTLWIQKNGTEIILRQIKNETKLGNKLSFEKKLRNICFLFAW